ncbi:hypothetical protein SAMN05216360_11089 [Methylobacterium phyllostachyos]|uniref:Uncharacterized protein n=1 Tax=Methylobacterium phyllostachyos TaxID=582672 RepID=A0A1H0DAT7_9HYPH|nr:hypothetical protein [Methylobacterium phyllostachyos]SDN67272.1 hypothetical protein SAMN05216360_11089 [Methylobacterium phyllostachyos]
MLKFLSASAACLILCGGAAAQDMPGLATLSPPDLTQQGTGTSEPASATGRPAGDLSGTRETPSGANRAVADLKVAPGSSRPWCGQERRVGTGAGFCLIN